MEPFFLIVVVFIAAFTQGSLGFGSGMLCMALLPLVYDGPGDFEDLVAVVAVFCLLINTIILLQLRSAFQWRSLVYLVGGAVLGVPLGVWALGSLGKENLQLALGIVMIFYAAQHLGLRLRRSQPLSDAWGLPFGVVGGFLGGAINVGGPTTVIYVTLRDWHKDQMKATLQGFFLVITLIQVPLLVADGRLGWEHVPKVGLGLVPLLAGIGLGTLLYNRIDSDRFARVVILAIGLAGVYYLACGLGFVAPSPVAA